LIAPRANRATSHDVLFTKEISESSDEGEFHWGSEYHTLKCRGCGTVSFAEIAWNSEDTDFEGQPHMRTTLYPSRGVRKPIEGNYVLPPKVRVVYLETLTALSNTAPILSAIGIRAVVEAICADKGSRDGNLEKKIDDLVANGSLAAQQADFLHLQRFMGNAAAHEIEPPDEPELRAALDIVENMLKTLYILPELAKEMKRSQTQLQARNSRLGRPTSSSHEDT
jgi:Domain of unknown function (DUF4145)